MCDGYFISHGVVHYAVPESARQNMSAQEAAEEVDVEELKRIAKEAADKAKDEKDGQELCTQPKPNKGIRQVMQALQ